MVVDSHFMPGADRPVGSTEDDEVARVKRDVDVVTVDVDACGYGVCGEDPLGSPDG